MKGSNRYTKPIIFQRQTTSNDGAGGKEKIGFTNIYECLADIEEKQLSKLSDSNNPTFRNYFLVSFWKDNNFEPKESDLISLSGKVLSISEIVSDDFKFYLTAYSKR